MIDEYNLIFEPIISTLWIYILAAVFMILLVSSMIWSRLKSGYSLPKIVVISGLRTLLIFFVCVLLLNPGKETSIDHETPVEVPFFIDSSFSSGLGAVCQDLHQDSSDDSYLNCISNEIQSQILDDDNLYSKCVPRIVMFSDSSENISQLSELYPHGVFRTRDFINYINSDTFKYPAIVLMSDFQWRNLYNVNMHFKKPIFIPDFSARFRESWISNAEYFTQSRQAKVVINKISEDSIEGTLQFIYNRGVNLWIDQAVINSDILIINVKNESGYAANANITIESNNIIIDQFEQEIPKDGIILERSITQSADNISLLNIEMTAKIDSSSESDLLSYARIKKAVIDSEEKTFELTLDEFPGSENRKIMLVSFDPLFDSDNPYNNDYLIEVNEPAQDNDQQDSEDKINVHLIFGKVSYDFSFLKRFLEKHRNINLITHVANADNRYFWPEPLGSQDILIFGDITSRGLPSSLLQKISNFISNNGKYIFLALDTNLNQITDTSLGDLIGIESSQANPSYSDTNYQPLDMTTYGKEEYFLNFRFQSENEARKIWQELEIYYSPRYIVQSASQRKILAKMDNIPAVIESRNGFSILFSGLWKTDFHFHNFDMETNYLDQFYEEGIFLRGIEDDSVVTVSSEGSSCSIENQVFQYNQEVLIECENLPLEYSGFKIISHKEPGYVRYISIEDDQERDLRYIRFVPDSIGRYSYGAVKDAGDENPEFEVMINEGYFYVSFPEDELPTTDNHADLMNEIAELSQGKVISIDEFVDSFPKQVIIHQEKQQSFLNKIVWFLLSIFILLGIEWAVRKWM